MKNETGVLICGAGAAGLMLAIELARRNVPFRLIDKLDGPFAGSRGKGIQPRTQEIFEDIGIIDRVVAAGGAYPPQREHRDDGSFTNSDMMEIGKATPAEPYHIPLMLPQFLTEKKMRERLAELGHTPEFGSELLSFVEDENGVTARVATQSGEQTIRAFYLVGADGGRSFVRGALGIEFPGETLGIRAIVADVVQTGLGRDAWHRFGEGDLSRQISLCPLMGTDLFQVQAPIPLEGDVDLTAEGLNKMFAERTKRSDIKIHSVNWASAYNMNKRLADKYRVGRVFLVGDAAHIHPPTGGQGLNTSIQDTYNLGWKLAAVLGGAPEALLDTYEEERRPIAAEMLGLSTKLLDASKRGEMKRGREVHQLDLNYAGSSIAMEAPARTDGVRAADRAPDAPMRGAAGQTVRLFDVFRGPHWTLIGYEAKREAVPPRWNLHIHIAGRDLLEEGGRDLIDEDSCFRETYALNLGDWLLVRPDGYIGAIVGAGEVAALETYMSNVGLST